MLGIIISLHECLKDGQPEDVLKTNVNAQRRKANMLQVLIGLTAGLAAPFIAAGAGAVVGASGMGRVLMSGWL